MQTDIEGEMDEHSVLVRVIGHKLDDLRRAASHIASQYQTEWHTEPRASGTAFCFDSEKTSILFVGYCKISNVPVSREP